MNSNPLSGICKVIDASELETATLTGWKLVEVFSTTISVGTNPETQPPTYPGGCPQTIYRDVYAPVARFLMMKDDESALASMSLEVSQATESARKAQDDAQVARKEAQTARDALSSEKIRNEGLSASFTRAQGEAQKLREQLLTMEKDLAKVRREVGEKEFTRIVGV